MGKAARWLNKITMCFSGMKRGKENVGTSSNCSEKEKKRRSCAKSAKEPRRTVEQIPATHLGLRISSSVLKNEKLLKERANAMAAATAAAGDAAVAVAEAALAVARARLTGQGGGGAMFSGDREERAATKIQKVFRCYLARKALTALKALVKVQALFRGYLARKQIAATCMKALIRAQAAAIRYQRACCSINNENPVTPLTTFRGDTFIGPPYPRYPSYLADTESSKARLRPRISPKQRLKSATTKRLSHIDKASRYSISGVGMQTCHNEIMASRPSLQKRSHSQFQEDLAFFEVLM